MFYNIVVYNCWCIVRDIVTYVHRKHPKVLGKKDIAGAKAIMASCNFLFL